MTQAWLVCERRLCNLLTRENAVQLGRVALELGARDLRTCVEAVLARSTWGSVLRRLYYGLY